MRFLLFLAALFDIFNNRDVPAPLILALFLPLLFKHDFSFWYPIPLIILVWFLGLLGPGDALALIALTLYLGAGVLDLLYIASTLALLFMAGFTVMRFGVGLSPVLVLLPLAWLLPNGSFLALITLAVALISAKEKELKRYFSRPAPKNWLDYPTTIWKKDQTVQEGIPFLPFLLMASLILMP